MPKPKEFCVIGLGAFGSTLATELYKRGHVVLGIDINEKLVNEHQDRLTQTLQLDATNEAALKAAGVADYDYCIIAIGDNIEDNILATQTILDLGIKQVWSRAENQRHANILGKMGVQQVVDPELEAAYRCARILSSKSVLDFIEFSPGFSLAQIKVGSANNGKTLKEINFRQKYDAMVIAIQRHEQSIPVATPEETIYEGDILFVAGKTEAVEKIGEV
jgi:trk system potassium uptake protein